MCYFSWYCVYRYGSATTYEGESTTYFGSTKTFVLQRRRCPGKCFLQRFQPETCVLLMLLYRDLASTCIITIGTNKLPFIQRPRTYVDALLCHHKQLFIFVLNKLVICDCLCCVTPTLKCDGQIRA